MAYLRMLDGNGERRIPLEGERLVVGRASGADLALSGDRKASATHCRIDRTQEGHRLYDLESQNGTWVNGRRVRKHLLRPGDVICIGTTSFRFEVPRPRRPRRGSPAAKSLDVLKEAWQKFLSVAGPKDLQAARDQLQAGLEEARRLLDDPETERLRRVASWTRRLVHERDPSRLVASMLESVVELAGAERGFLLLLPPRGASSIPFSIGFPDEARRKPSFRLACTLGESVAREGQAVVSANAASDPQLRTLFGDQDPPFGSVACVPVRAATHRLGALYLDHRFESGLFKPADLPFLLGAADQIALALEKERWVRAGADREREEEDEFAAAERNGSGGHTGGAVARIGGRRDLKYAYEAIVGESEPLLGFLAVLDRVTDSDAPVFLKGESGAGKELAARALHFNGPRREGPFISLNCAAIPEPLFESELFGHVRGSFTGASSDKQGLFALAHGGTLFLDEIAEMPTALQAKLLRVLQEREIRPVGARRATPVDVRIVTASNKDLAELVRRGGFRTDLYHRIYVLEVSIPPLRARREDVPLLVRHFLARSAERRGEEPREVSPEALALLTAYDWPGNVRELENEVERALTLADGAIGPDVLSAGVRAAALAAANGKVRTLKRAVREATQEVERTLIREALRHESGNKSAAARRLGISRPTLDAKMNQLGIPRHPA